MPIIVPLTKKHLLEKLLKQGQVQIAVNIQVPGVELPVKHMKDETIRLNLSYKFGMPMSLEEVGVSATLSFSGDIYNCKVPWQAIYIMVAFDTEIVYMSSEDLPKPMAKDDLKSLAAEEMKRVDSKKPPNHPFRLIIGDKK